MPFTLTMPKLSPTMEEGMIAKWHKKIGDFVAAGDLMIEVATDKATVEHLALDEGWLRKILIADGQEAIVNQPIAIFSETADESIEGYVPEGAAAPSSREVAPAAVAPTAASAAKSPEPMLAAAPSSKSEALNTAAASPPAVRSERIVASPLARRLAKERNLDLSAVAGSGPRGRIVQRDLDNAPPLALGAARRARLPLGTYEEEGLTPMRRTIAKRLLESKVTIPHFYLQQSIDAGPLVALRQQLKNGNINITFNDLVVKATALTLRNHPIINSGFNSAANSIIRFKTVDIAIGVATAEGLITPIVRYADDKTILEISAEIKGLSQRAREGKLDPSEYVGGSFTISNLGMFGTTSFQAIINPPQAAILAVSAVVDQPVVKNGCVVAGKVLNISLSADHRVIDGVGAAKFVHDLQRYLENPALISIVE
jgi:pyruvate dehydrogenase E2 component (dihydrolipoamide acetyltransferase)